MKPKSKKALIIITGLVAVGTAVYLIFRKDQSKIGGFVRKVESAITGENMGLYEGVGLDENLNIETGETTITSSGGCSNYVSESFPLKKCMKGSNVAAVQTILNELYIEKIGEKIEVDRYFGPATEAALYKATGSRQVTKNQYNSLASAAAAKANIDDESSFEPSFWDNILGVII